MSKRFAFVLAAVGLLSFTAGAWGQVSNVHSTFSGDPTSEVTVSWRTPPFGGTSMQYGLTSDLGSSATGSAFLSSGGFQHHVTLSGLQPNTTYYYKPAGGGPLGTFKTAPADNSHFRFAVIGDVQGYSSVSGKWTAASNFLAGQDLLFWVPLGDLVQNGATQTEYDAFWSGCKALSQSVPVMPIIGNHDEYGYATGWPQNYLDQFRLPDNGSAGYQGHWWAIEVGPMQFIGLNNSPGGGPLSNEQARATQAAWMDQQMSQSDARWKFASLHTPTWSTGGHGGENLNSDYRPTWEAHHATAVFSGHTHSFEVTHPMRDGERVDSWAEGTFYYNSAGINSNGAVQGAWFSEFWQSESGLPLVGIVDVFEDEVIVTTYNYQTGEIFHQVTIPEPASMSLLGAGALMTLIRRR